MNHHIPKFSPSKLLTITACSALILTGCSSLTTSSSKPVFVTQSPSASPSGTSSPTFSPGPAVMPSSASPRATASGTGGAQAQMYSQASSPAVSSTPALTDALAVAFPEKKMPYANAAEYWNHIESTAPSVTRTAPTSVPISPENYALTADEKDAIAQGKFVPSNDKHPAFNMPKPEFPESLKTSKDASLQAAQFMVYWSNEYRYTSATGQINLLDRITQYPQNSMIHQIIASNLTLYASGGWHDNCEPRFKVADKIEVIPAQDGTVDMYVPVYLSTKTCTLHAGDGRVLKQGAAQIPMVMQVRYQNTDPTQSTMQVVRSVEATGRFYQLPMRAKALVCTFSPNDCPQDTYDALRQELANLTAQKQGAGA